MRGVLALSYLKVSLYIRVISRNVEILSLALIIPRLILGTSVLMIFIYLPTLGLRLLSCLLGVECLDMISHAYVFI